MKLYKDVLYKEEQFLVEIGMEFHVAGEL